MKIVLDRRTFGWTARFTDTKGSKPRMPEGEELPLPFTADAKAGTVLADMDTRFPGAEIGIKSTCFGPNTVMIYGATVWMKPARDRVRPTDAQSMVQVKWRDQ